MRFTPFGSGSLQQSDSASLAEHAVTTNVAITAGFAQLALTGSRAAEDALCEEQGPYESYVPPSY